MALDTFKNIDLTIEHANRDNFIPRQFSSEGDISGRTLTVQITENGVPAEITGAILRLVWTNKTTGLTGVDDFAEVDASNGIFTIDYPQFNTRGTVEMAIQIYFQGKVTTVRKFEMTVQPINGNFRYIIESQEFYALTQALNEATKANPRGIFNSLTELQNAFPHGTDGTYLVKDGDTAKSYIWKNNEWFLVSNYQQMFLDKQSVSMKNIDVSTYISMTSLQKQSVSNNVSRGFYNKDHTVTDSYKWSFKVLGVKKEDSLSYSLSTNQTKNDDVFMFFDNSGNLISSSKEFSGTFTASQNGFVVLNHKINYDRKNASDKPIGTSDLILSSKISGSIRLPVSKTKIDLVREGYQDIYQDHDAYIETKKAYTSNYVNVIPESWYKITGAFGEGNGVYAINKPIYKSTKGDNNVVDDLVYIPKNVTSVMISSLVDSEVFFDLVGNVPAYFLFSEYNQEKKTITALPKKAIENILETKKYPIFNGLNSGYFDDKGFRKQKDNASHRIIPMNKNDYLTFELPEVSYSFSTYLFITKEKVNAYSEKKVTFTAEDDGILVLNYPFVSTKENVPQIFSDINLTKSYIDYEEDIQIFSKGKDGYHDLGQNGGTPYFNPNRKDLYTTESIEVKRGGIYFISGLFGRSHGVVGYDADMKNGMFLYRLSKGNNYVDKDVLFIPDNIKYIEMSTFAGNEMKLQYSGVDTLELLVSSIKKTKYSDLENLPLTTSQNFPEGSPYDYKFFRQWGRRDFYNDYDSFGEKIVKFDTNIFAKKSAINPILGSGIQLSVQDGKLLAKGSGLVRMQISDYFPFSTYRLKIGDISSGTVGFTFGDNQLSNYIDISTSSTNTIINVYAADSLVATKTLNKSFKNTTLQVQHTGRSVILFEYKNDVTAIVGRCDFGTFLDARQEKFTTIWKSYIRFESTNDSTVNSISEFNSAIRSGSNSVSIRFLTYENGDFIQRGNYMYFLVEGTGETIPDLFTQLIKINFATGEVQSIGAVFLVRGDGVDEGILLGDDSIKVVYDRRDKKWKGISCGMEYQGLANDNDRPKLYFETFQDFLEGGIIIVRNAVQIKDSSGLNAGTSETKYSEDYDFYFDDDTQTWNVTGNFVSGGYAIYTTPDLKKNYGTKIVYTQKDEGVRDTGNQFVKFGENTFLTTGGTNNKLGIREISGKYLGELDIENPLSSETSGPWCTLVPYKNGDKTEIYLLSFDRVDLTSGAYDHGGLYCWKALKK